MWQLRDIFIDHYEGLPELSIDDLPVIAYEGDINKVEGNIPYIYFGGKWEPLVKFEKVVFKV